MRPRPKKPGETVAEYNAFIATLPKMGGRPKTGGGAPSTPPTPPTGPTRGNSVGGTKSTPRTMGGAASKMGPGPAKTGAPVMRAKGGMVKGKKK
jgi:hypothetical protein